MCDTGVVLIPLVGLVIFWIYTIVMIMLKK